MATFNAKNFRLAGINAVFFDLDNTLIETRKADIRTCRKYRFEGESESVGRQRSDVSRFTYVAPATKLRGKIHDVLPFASSPFSATRIIPEIDTSPLAI
ncbi:N-acylneuraminate-9-phosphatase-like, partial [Vespula squamosa]